MLVVSCEECPSGIAFERFGSFPAPSSCVKKPRQTALAACCFPLLNVRLCCVTMRTQWKNDRQNAGTMRMNKMMEAWARGSAQNSGGRRRSGVPSRRYNFLPTNNYVACAHSTSSNQTRAPCRRRHPGTESGQHALLFSLRFDVGIIQQAQRRGAGEKQSRLAAETHVTNWLLVTRPRF